jgi:hypothetical protein
MPLKETATPWSLPLSFPQLRSGTNVTPLLTTCTVECGDWGLTSEAGRWRHLIDIGLSGVGLVNTFTFKWVFLALLHTLYPTISPPYTSLPRLFVLLCSSASNGLLFFCAFSIDLPKPLPYSLHALQIRASETQGL